MFRRLEKTLTDERTILEVHRNRILKEMTEEREHLTAIAKKERELADEMKRKYENILHETTRKHQIELETQKEALVNKHTVSEVWYDNVNR